MTSSSAISPHPPSPGAYRLLTSTACIWRHETHCRELCYYYCIIYLCPEDMYIREQRENNIQSTHRLGTTSISIYSGLARHTKTFVGGLIDVSQRQKICPSSDFQALWLGKGRSGRKGVNTLEANFALKDLVGLLHADNLWVLLRQYSTFSWFFICQLQRPISISIQVSPFQSKLCFAQALSWNVHSFFLMHFPFLPDYLFIFKIDWQKKRQVCQLFACLDRTFHTVYFF